MFSKLILGEIGKEVRGRHNAVRIAGYKYGSLPGIEGDGDPDRASG